MPKAKQQKIQQQLHALASHERNGLSNVPAGGLALRAVWSNADGGKSFPHYKTICTRRVSRWKPLYRILRFVSFFFSIFFSVSSYNI